MSNLPDIAMILGVALALAAGSWWMADPRRTVLENTVIGASTLLGSAALLVAVGGHFVGWRFPLWPLVLLLPLLIPRSVSFQEKPALFRRNALAAWRGVLGLRGANLLLGLYLVFVCALTLFLSLAPPNANDYDSLVYHLAAPARYLLEGRIVELSYDHHTYFPFALEMLFTLGLQTSGPVLAKLFHWLMLPLCCLAIVAIGQRHFSFKAGLLGAALFASIPVVLIEATTAYIDLGLAAFVLVAFGCFLNWLQTRETAWLGWCGAMCGFACNTKYFGVLFFGWLLVWALGDMAARKKFEFAGLAVFCGLTMLLGGFYYARNWLWTGNPVFPFAYEIFGGKGWTLEMAKAYARDQESFGFGRGILDWIFLPWRAVMAPLNFNQPFWPLSDAPLESGAVSGRFEVLGHVAQTVVGPALLAFGAPLAFFKRKPPVLGFLLWSFAFFWLFWAATSQQLRYLIPSLALLAACCGWGVLRYCERGAILRWTATLALVAWLVFAPALTIRRLRDAIPVALGLQPSEYFLTRTFAGYDAMIWASQNTPSNAVFAIYGEPRCFYLQRQYFWADDAHNNLIDYAAASNGEKLVRALKALGATHVLWNTEPAKNGGFGGAPPQIEDAFTRGLVFEIYAARGYRVLQIR